MRQPVSLVMPMFNESKSVDTTIPLLLEKLAGLFSDFEIVIADDASTDDSAEKVREWTRRDPRIVLIRLPHNQRFGGALRAAFQQAGKEFLVYTDFDLPVDLDCLPSVLLAFQDADVLTGFSDEITKHQSRYAMIIPGATT
jgi:glycosyltransferase involved in cell wall biosynthesis